MYLLIHIENRRMRMKKNVSLMAMLVIVLVFVMILGGCASAPLSRAEIEKKTILHPNIASMISDENQAILMIPGLTCIIGSVNGTRVSMGASPKTNYYRIPSGNISLRIDPYNSAMSDFRSTTVTLDTAPDRVYRIQITGRNLRFVDITPEN
jgi:hypothetical protein